MVAFALSAVVSIGLLAIIINFAPAVTKAFLHSKKRIPNWGGIIVTSLLFGVLLIGLVFAILMSVVVHYHPWLVVESPVSTLLFSNGFMDAVVGLVFAAFFLHWISESHRFDEADAEDTRSLSNLFQQKPKRPKWLVFEGYLVLALFIVGSSDIIRTVFDRLNSVKAGAEGFELSLRPSATVSAVNNQPGLASQIGSGANRDAASFGRAQIPGLAFLSEIDGMIERDDRYLFLYRWRNRDHDPYLPTGVSKKNDELRIFVEKFVAPLARCQARLWSATGSNPLSSRAYWVLEAPMHEFSDAVQYDVSDPTTVNSIIQDVTSAFTIVTSDALREAFVKRELLHHTSTQTKEHNEEGSVPEINGDEIVSKKCQALRNVVCASGQLSEVPRPNLGTDQSARFVDIRKGILNCYYNGLVTGNEHYDVSAFLARQLYSALRRSYNNRQWTGRPYAALIAACVSSIIGQNESAAEEVDTWLQQRRDENWYDLRMKLIRASLTEYWLTADLVAASNASLQDFHLKQLGQIVWQIMDIPGYDEEENFWHTKDVQTSFIVDYAYTGDQVCEVGKRIEKKLVPAARQMQEDFAILKYTQLTYMIEYIERAFKDRDFSESDKIENVERMLKELNSADLGCMHLLSQDESKVGEQIAFTRAQIYRLNAMWRCYQYDGIEKSLSNDERKQKLSAALEAAIAGLRILEESRNRELALHETKDQSLAEKIKPSEVLQEYVKLKVLAQNLTQSLSALTVE